MPDQQTAAQQAVLIAEMVDAYTAAEMARCVPRLEQEAEYSVRDVAALTADLQASGLLPLTHSPATAGGRSVGIQAASASALRSAQEYLKRGVGGVAKGLQEHGWLYLVAAGGLTGVPHPYLTEDQQIALTRQREVTTRFKAELKAVCDPRSPEHDAAASNRVLKRAVTGMMSGPGASPGWLSWVLFLGVGGLMAYYLWAARNKNPAAAKAPEQRR